MRMLTLGRSVFVRSVLGGVVGGWGVGTGGVVMRLGNVGEVRRGIVLEWMVLLSGCVGREEGLGWLSEVGV